MLVELRLENYAVIDNLAVEFAAGLNLLTGETGAGKSILIDALALLLGEKASTDVIRSGTYKAVITAVFEADGAAEKSIAQVLENTRPAIAASSPRPVTRSHQRASGVSVRLAPVSRACSAKARSARACQSRGPRSTSESSWPSSRARTVTARHGLSEKSVRP